MRLGEWAKQQGISYITAWRWVKAGKMPVPVTKTSTGTILVDTAPLAKRRTTVIYARVSSATKKDDLARQAARCEEFCRGKGWEIDRVVTEVASGMNDNRRKLMGVLASRPGRIVVEHKDRLTRFGFNYFAQMLPWIDCELVVVNRDAEAKDDLMKDLVAVITSFCCRLYGQRRGSTAAKKLVAEATK